MTSPSPLSRALSLATSVLITICAVWALTGAHRFLGGLTTVTQGPGIAKIEAGAAKTQQRLLDNPATAAAWRASADDVARIGELLDAEDLTWADTALAACRVIRDGALMPWDVAALRGACDPEQYKAERDAFTLASQARSAEHAFDRTCVYLHSGEERTPYDLDNRHFDVHLWEATSYSAQVQIAQRVDAIRTRFAKAAQSKEACTKPLETHAQGQAERQERLGAMPPAVAEQTRTR